MANKKTALKRAKREAQKKAMQLLGLSNSGMAAYGGKRALPGSDEGPGGDATVAPELPKTGSDD